LRDPVEEACNDIAGPVELWTETGPSPANEAVAASSVGTEHIRQLVSITLLRNRYLGQSTTETDFFDEDCTTQRAKLIKWMRMRRTAHRVISMPRSNRVALEQGGYQFRYVKLPGLRVYGLAERGSYPMRGRFGRAARWDLGFSHGDSSGAEPDRTLATILFNDVVDSTKQAASEMG